MFSNLHTLNIYKNTFTDFNALVISLMSLPQLTNLLLDLENEDEVTLILENLPQLTYLNEKAITITDGDEYEEENVKNEEIEEEEVQEQLPQQNNKEETTKEINHQIETQMKSNNDVNNKCKEIIPKNENNEQVDIDININDNKVNDTNEYEKITKDIKDKLFNTSNNKEYSLEKEASTLNKITNKISTFFKNNTVNRNIFFSEFNSFFQSQLNHINSLKQSNIPKYLYIITVHFSKLEIYSFLKSKIYPLIQNQKMMVNLSPIVNLLIQIDNIIASDNRTIYKLISKFNDKVENAFNTEINKHFANLNEVIHNTQNLLETKNKEINDLNSHIKTLNQQIKNLNTINSRLKLDNDDTVPTNLLFNNNTNRKTNTERQNSFQFPTQLSTKNENLYCKTASSAMNKNKTMLSTVPYNTISKKKLINIINDIYSSKEIDDNINKSKHLPKETLEHYLYTYLKTKYTTQNQVKEWLSSIINAIKLYSKEDNEINLFNKILKNEIDDSYIYLPTQIKSTLETIILTLLNKKHPEKTSQEINTIFSKIKSGSIYLSEKLWKDICDILFLEDENKQMKFINIVYNFIKGSLTTNKTDNELILHSEGRSNLLLQSEESDIRFNMKQEKKILYKYLYQLLLGFHLKERVMYLKHLVEEFKKVDTNLDGVVDRNQFKELLKLLNLFNENEFEDKSECLIQITDVYNKNKITFSKVVNMLSKEVLDDGMVALDKIAMV